MTSRGLGWLEDTNPGMGSEKLSRAPGILIGSMPTADLRKYRKRRTFQGPFGACVALATARAIHVGMQIDGVDDPEYPSTRALYANGRFQEYAGYDPDTIPPLEDRGCYPRLLLESARKLGFTPWRFDPYGSSFDKHSPKNAALAEINKRPPSSALRNAIDQSGLRYFDASYIVGEARSRAIADGMNAARPIPFIIGMDVDTPFLWHRGSEPIRTIDANRIEGGHMLEVAAILPGGHALIDNWWEDWGGVDDIDDGYGILHVDLLGSKWVRNVYGILSAPTFGKGIA